jgi:hypothetical protein
MVVETNDEQVVVGVFSAQLTKSVLKHAVNGTCKSQLPLLAIMYATIVQVTTLPPQTNLLAPYLARLPIAL